MKKNSWNEWLTLVANLSVVAGIVFLAVEIGQNTRVLEETTKWSRIHALEANFESFSRWRMRLFEDGEMRDIWSRGCNGGLEGDDLFRYRQLAWDNLIMERNTWERAIASDADKWLEHAARRQAQLLLDCPGLLAEFNGMTSIRQLSPDWYSAIQVALADLQSVDR